MSPSHGQQGSASTLASGLGRLRVFSRVTLTSHQLLKTKFVKSWMVIRSVETVALWTHAQRVVSKDTVNGLGSLKTQQVCILMMLDADAHFVKIELIKNEIDLELKLLVLDQLSVKF